MYVTFVTMLNRLSFLHIIGENHEFLSFLFFFKFSWQFGKNIFLRLFTLLEENEETLFSNYIPPHTPPHSPPHTFWLSSDVSTSLLSMFDNISLQKPFSTKNFVTNLIEINFQFSEQFGKVNFSRQFILLAEKEETLFPDYTPPHTFHPPLDVSTLLLSMFDNFSLQ